jgi:hypothetical protein
MECAQVVIRGARDDLAGALAAELVIMLKNPEMVIFRKQMAGFKGVCFEIVCVNGLLKGTALPSSLRLDNEDYALGWSTSHRKMELYLEGACPVLPSNSPGRVQVTFRHVVLPRQAGDDLHFQVIISSKSSTLFVPRVELVSLFPNSSMKPQRNRCKSGNGWAIANGETVTFDVSYSIPTGYTQPLVQMPMVKLWTKSTDLYFRFSEPFRPLLQPDYHLMSSEDEGRPDVWDRLARKRIMVEALSTQGRAHLHTPLDTVFLHPLPPYELPDGYMNQLMEEEVKFLGSPWGRRDNETRVKMYHDLLFLEEAYHLQQLQRFALGGIPLEYCREGIHSTLNSMLTLGDCLLVVEVPNLSEYRPSVLRNDIILIWQCGTIDVEWEGRVVETMQHQLVCLVNPSFKRTYPSLAKPLFNVRFTHGRTSWRSYHRAVDKVNMNLISPTGLPAPFTGRKTILKQQDLRLLTTKCALSSQQLQVVQKVINFEYSGSPFLILGPFGSGKSTTLAECVAQILFYQPTSRILLCAQTNSGADILVRKLAFLQTITPAVLYRASSPYHTNYDREIEHFFSEMTDGVRSLLPVHLLNEKKVIVTTCMNASTLYGVGVKPFTHVMIDEAGQLFQPELLIPLCLATSESNIVLVGDFHQLGPRVCSRAARSPHLKLDESPLEELFKACAWYKNSHQERFIAKLNMQHRCPAGVSEFPLTTFYEDFQVEFQSHVSEKSSAIPPAVKKVLFKGKFHPVIFHKFRGLQERVSHSASIYNTREAQVVASVICTMLAASNGAVCEEEIAVIAEQYQHRQVLKGLLRDAKINRVFVGSAMALQGKEFPYVFISTAICRSPDDDINGRVERMVWRDYRKLNTAMTRASKLVYVVGDPNTLSYDQYWTLFMRYCEMRGSVIAEGTSSISIPSQPAISLQPNPTVPDWLRRPSEIPQKKEKDTPKSTSEWNTVIQKQRTPIVVTERTSSVKTGVKPPQNAPIQRPSEATKMTPVPSGASVPSGAPSFTPDPRAPQLPRRVDIMVHHGEVLVIETHQGGPPIVIPVGPNCPVTVTTFLKNRVISQSALNLN